jgi:transcriptional regulator with XRE-family HTH domain
MKERAEKEWGAEERVAAEDRDRHEVELGQAIRRRRICGGWSLEDIAARASLSPTSVRALELGRGSTVATLVKVLRAIDETGLITDWAESGRAFSPIDMLRGKASAQKDAAPKRVSRGRRKNGRAGVPR